VVDLGLKYRASSGAREAELCGEFGGYGLHIEIPTRAVRSSQDRVRLRLDSRGRIPSSIWLRPKVSTGTLTARFRGAGCAGEIETRDSEFDSVVAVGGDDATLLSLMTPSVRRALVAAVRGASLRIQSGQLFSAPSLSRGADWCFAVMEAEIALADKLIITPDDVHRRLLESAQREPHDEARRKKFKVFFREARDPDLVRSAIDSALSDSHPKIQLYGAARRGRSRGLAETRRLILDEHTPLEVRLEAFTYVVGAYSFGDVLPILCEAFESDVTLLRVHAAEALGVARYEPALTSFARVGLDAHPSLAMSMSRAAVHIGGPAAEAFVLRLLDHPSSSVKLMAARGLEEIGTVVSVEKLASLGAAVLLPTRTKRACRVAVEAIQRRVHNGGQGQLSLASNSVARGALSPTDSGALAVVRSISDVDATDSTLSS
jgi:hypothetical protein